MSGWCATARFPRQPQPSCARARTVSRCRAATVCSFRRVGDDGPEWHTAPALPTPGGRRASGGGRLARSGVGGLSVCSPGRPWWLDVAETGLRPRRRRPDRRPPRRRWIGLAGCRAGADQPIHAVIETTSRRPQTIRSSRSQSPTSSNSSTTILLTCFPNQPAVSMTSSWSREGNAPLALGSRAVVTRPVGPRELARTEEITELRRAPGPGGDADGHLASRGVYPFPRTDACAGWLQAIGPSTWAAAAMIECPPTVLGTQDDASAEQMVAVWVSKDPPANRSVVNGRRKLTRWRRVKIDPLPGHEVSSVGTLPRSRSLSR
jgi:hypothetical protein